MQICISFPHFGIVSSRFRITMSKRAILNCARTVFYITDPCASSPLYSTCGDPPYVPYDAMRDGGDINPDAARGVCEKTCSSRPMVLHV